MTSLYTAYSFKCSVAKTRLILFFKLHLKLLIRSTKTLSFSSIQHCTSQLQTNRPLALRGHVTNASFKQWVGILLMPKIDRTHKNYLTPEIRGATHLREIFYGTLIFPQSSIICICPHVGGHTLAPNMADKTTFCLDLVKRLIVTLRCVVNVPTSTFQHSPWSLRAKFVFRKS